MNLIKRFFIAFFIFGLLTISTISFSTDNENIIAKTYKGVASFYNNKFNGRKTASGEIFSNNNLTAANNFLKLGTIVKVFNPKNGKSVIVKINDRMNKNNHRLLDLTENAARQLGLIEQGIGHVEIVIIKEV